MPARDVFYETPEAVVRIMFEQVPPIMKPNSFTLEPSAGLGAIARHLSGCNLTLIEKDENRADELRKTFKNVICMDFLNFYAPFSNGNFYDRVYMSPPLDNHQDIDHVYHAYKMLAPGGILVSVMGEGPFFLKDRKSKDFREWSFFKGAGCGKLPENSFKECGTNINTWLIVLTKAK
jgi:hypothetical protein